MVDLLGDLYVNLAARPADGILGWRGEIAVSNSEFLQRVGAWHRLLRDRSGQHFALYLEDSIEFAAALMGAWHAGKTVWLTADTLAVSNQALAVSVDGFLGEFPVDCAPLQAPADGGNAAITTVALDPHFPALVVHTSGTTGVAEAIPKRLSQLSSEVATLEALFGAAIGAADVVASVSQQHIYGLLFRVLWPLATGRAMQATTQNFPEELAQMLGRRASILIVSPAHLKRLPDYLDWRGTKAHLRAVFSSGGPLPQDVAHATGALLGQVPIEVYGSSETGGVAWRQRTPSADESWSVFPGVKWRVSEEDSRLEVQSPHLADAAWFRVADRVAAHGTGRFLLNGRSDRIVKIEEKRISLDAIETLLSASPLVESVRIVVCDETPGQRQQLAAFVVTSALGRELLADAGKLAFNRNLRALLVGMIEPVAYPRRWRYLEQLPVNAQGKTTRAMLLAVLDARPREPQWHVVEQSERQVKLELTVPEDLFYFEGHFPQSPILPGVVQLDWAIVVGRRHFVLPPNFRAAVALKFQNVIQPCNVVTLELAHDMEKNSLNFKYLSEKGQHASGRLLFGPAIMQPAQLAQE